MSTAVGYTLQIIAQGKASPAPAAIILSMESVFASLAGWLILNQILDNYKIIAHDSEIEKHNSMIAKLHGKKNVGF